MKSAAALVVVLFILSIHAKNLERNTSQNNEVEKCHEVQCERQECPRPKRWNAEKCKCECPKKSKCFPVGAIFDEDTCSWCRAKTCETNKVNDNKCNCICKNTKPNPIPAGHNWNEKTCELENTGICANPMPSDANIPPHRWNNRTCLKECIDAMPEDANVPPHYWNKNTCTKECVDPMPEDADVPPHFWNKNTCTKECVDPMPEDANVPPHFWNKNTCTKECIDPKPSESDGIHEWDDQTCKLYCIDSCPSDGCEYENQEWCDDTCSCKCKAGLKELCSYPNTVWCEETCTCDCVTELDCPANFEFIGETCQCGCLKTESDCLTQNSKWHLNQTSCKCECPNAHTFDKTFCSSLKISTLPKLFKTNSCECECKTTPVCDTTIQSYNSSSCACDCKTPPTSCPVNYAWTQSTCCCTQCTSCASYAS